MMKIYKSFEEVEKEIKEQTPSIIYKYRTWENDFHKNILTENEVWFAHPHTLNDPYDIRPPYNFITENIDWDLASQKILDAISFFEPHLSKQELSIQVEKRISEIKESPISYFQKNRKDYLLESSHYDSIGVFSCCSSFKNEAMWAHYGNNHNGFAIGFNTVELARTLNCTLGYVDYNDKPIDYYVFGNNEGLLKSEICQKSTKWSYEEELRFVTFTIGNSQSRARKYPLNVISEIVFGMTTSKEVQDEIIEIAKSKIPNVPIYKVDVNADQFGFNKKQIT